MGFLGLVLLAQVQVFGKDVSDPIHTKPLQPYIQYGEPVYADIDTTHQIVYLLLENSLWSYDLNNDKWDILAEYETMPEPLSNLDFAYNHVENKLLLWSRGVGTIYEITPNEYVIKRIDESSPHKNQFGHFPFLHEGELHAFGGYGFWKFKNYITRYKPELKGWAVINIPEESPLPTSRSPYTGLFLNELEELYIYGGEEIEQNRTDDRHAKKVEANDIWKYSFKHSKWDRVAEINEKSGKFFSTRRLEQIGRSNSVSTSFYSRNSNLWYIPFSKHNISTKEFYVKPYSLNKKVNYSIIELPIGESREFLISNYLFDNSNNQVVLVGVKPVTNSNRIPVHIQTIPEDSLLTRLQVQSAAFSYAYLGGALFLVLSFGFLFWRYKYSFSEDLNNNELDFQKLIIRLKSNELERNLLKTLFESSIYLETSELEQLIWPKIDNYDYRRKLRNETIKSLNSKFQALYPNKGELILRKKDSEDSRRFLYGLHDDIKMG